MECMRIKTGLARQICHNCVPTWIIIIIYSGHNNDTDYLTCRTRSQRTALRLFGSFILAASSTGHSQSSSSHPHVSPTLKSAASASASGIKRPHDHASAALRAHAGSEDIELEPLHPESIQDKEAQQCSHKHSLYSQAGQQEQRFRPPKEAMKFSHSIQFNAVPDWTSHYINYSNLKKL